MSRIRKPIGVAGLVTPWNFPSAIPAWKLAPALICGNTAVIKPASDTPACLVRFVELLVEGGIPDGVVNVVTGSGGEVGNAIVDHPDIRVISEPVPRFPHIRIRLIFSNPANLLVHARRLARPADKATGRQSAARPGLPTYACFRGRLPGLPGCLA